jgi:hypothetical protein
VCLVLPTKATTSTTSRINMGRKRKAGLTSVLSSLPAEVRLSFAPTSTSVQEHELPEASPIDVEDLIVQRVHVSQPTPTPSQKPPTEITAEVSDAPTAPARKKQRISDHQSSTIFSLENIATNISLHYKNQKSVPQHLKKCELNPSHDYISSLTEHLRFCPKAPFLFVI